MKHLILTTLLLTSPVLASEKIFIGIQAGRMQTDRAITIKGGIAGITASTENGATFFTRPVKTNISVSYMAGEFTTAGFKTPVISMQKEISLTNQFKGFYPSAFGGVAYKWIDTVMPTSTQKDPMINSRLHFDLGLGINYASNKWRLGIKYLHKSNGEIALPNRGYNFVITELTFKI